MDDNPAIRHTSLRRARALGHRYAVGTLVLAAVLFAAITLWRFAASDSLLEGIDFLYAVPIALVAARFRAVGGAAAAALGVGLVTVWAETAAVTLSPEGYLIRAVTFVAVALVVGVQGERRQQGEDEAARWFSISTEMLCIADTSGRLTRVNEAWRECLGYTANELLGRSFTDLVHPEDLTRTQASLDAALCDLRTSAELDQRYRAKDGRWHWLSWSLRVDGDRLYAAGRDITERKRLERELKALAHEDALTGLPNRRAWDARLAEELARAVRSREPVSVVILDLDGLKAVNDSSGHAAGDELFARALCGGAWPFGRSTSSRGWAATSSEFCFRAATRLTPGTFSGAFASGFQQATASPPELPLGTALSRRKASCCGPTVTLRG